MSQDSLSKSRTRQDYLDFLDKRLPELHAMGKKHKHKDGETIPEQVEHTRENMATAKYPGVVALQQARLEWGSRAS